jgi:phage baseplate assembly protein W
MAEVAISLPFALNAYGSINFTESQSKIWSDRVLSVIGTLVGERVMQPTFGTEIPESLFNSTERMEQVIPVEVEKAFATYLQELTLVDTIITSDPENGSVYVDVVYGLPNDEQTNTVVALVAIAGKNPPVQENL